MTLELSEDTVCGDFALVNTMNWKSSFAPLLLQNELCVFGWLWRSFVGKGGLLGITDQMPTKILRLFPADSLG